MLFVFKTSPHLLKLLRRNAATLVCCEAPDMTETSIRPILDSIQAHPDGGARRKVMVKRHPLETIKIYRKFHGNQLHSC